MTESDGTKELELLLDSAIADAKQAAQELLLAKERIDGLSQHLGGLLDVHFQGHGMSRCQCRQELEAYNFLESLSGQTDE